MEKLIIPLDGRNYCTWKVQIRMLLMNLNLWSIVEGTTTAPVGEDATAAAVSTFNARLGKALSTVVLSISPSLLYLIGDPVDPVKVWKTLEGHYQKSSWAN